MSFYKNTGVPSAQLPTSHVSLIRSQQLFLVASVQWLQQKKPLWPPETWWDTLPSLFLCHTWSLPSSMNNALPISQLQDEGEPHDCVAELSISCSPRPDLSDQPLLNPDLLLFMDGSASRDPASGRCQAGFAICDSHGVLKSASLPSHYSAQAAELVALTRACHFATKQSVTIYTDSRYAFGVVCVFGALWKHRGFLKSDGSPILNHQLVAALLEAILLPSQVAVCKCAAHTNLSDPISAGNARADAAAKAAAARPPPLPTVCAVQVPSSLSAIQSLATPHDKQSWRQAGSAHTPEGWIGPNGNPCLPSALFHHYAKLTHGLDHASKGGMITLIAEHWFTKGFTPVAEKFCKACVICATHNPGKAETPTAQAAHPPPTRPFEHVMMDFIELNPAEDIRGQVKAALPTPAEEQLHNLKPGDYVVVKDFRRTRWNQKQWKGPFQILLVTQTAIKVAERATWIHASH
ncbi:uncharacterized protein isoform X2 [Takifugu rubripes]|uniref:uncharacterized protein isoform X2 n=1 Tax=Takifugu rubripes TaxID=31033 RepID=UPI001145E478|nr:uncharacterized protein LOC105418754 isoform X2 [Takifugu rubripes]